MDCDATPDAIAVMDRVLAIKPDDVQTQVSRAAIELDWKADTRPMHRGDRLHSQK